MSKTSITAATSTKATLKFIGQINTPYLAIDTCPNNIQDNGPVCEIALYDDYKEGLLGLSDGQDILILYWLGDASRNELVQTSRQQMVKGTFALRSPNRPNPIGAAVLPIENIRNGVITVKGLDCLNHTQLIDIKPAIKREVSNQ